MAGDYHSESFFGHAVALAEVDISESSKCDERFDPHIRCCMGPRGTGCSQLPGAVISTVDHPSRISSSFA
jgi:hypothetical protein